MIINEILQEKNMSMYKLAKLSGVPYATVNDICSGKRDIAKCEAGTVYNIAQVLGISVDDLLAATIVRRSSFENFKSTICHRLKDLGDREFIIDVLENRRIDELYKRRWYPETFYLLAMLDYISNENDVPLCAEYDELRNMRLAELLYPVDVLLSSSVLSSDEPMKAALKNAIPEFLKYNIIEGEIRNVI